MEKRGRKRKFNPSIPSHIDQDKLPDKCYWDKSATGHWYTTYKDEAKRQRRKRIAGPHARLFELHEIMEEIVGTDANTFSWLSTMYLKSPKFKKLAKSTQKDYRYCNDIVKNHPTKLNKPLSDVGLNKWSTPMVQKLVDQLVEQRGSSAANHALRYIRLLFKWGKNRGYILDNCAMGVEQANEAPIQQLVSDDVYARVLHHAIECGQLKPKTKGSAPAYIWIVMELAYLCRLRGIEVVTLTEDKALETGIRCDRTKRSRTNIAAWNPRLKAAWDAAIKYRDNVWKDRKTVVSSLPEERFIIVSGDGGRLDKSSFESAWQRFITRAIKDGVISQEERFSLHDLKRKGTTDTEGTRADKQEATGHRSSSMMDIYDKSIALVKPSSE